MFQQMMVQEAMVADMFQQMRVQQAMLADRVQEVAVQQAQTQGQLNTQTTVVTDLAAAMASMATDIAALQSAGRSDASLASMSEAETEASVPTSQPTIPYER